MVTMTTTAPALTKREWELAELITQELTNEDIANRLGISQSTVKNILTKLIDKIRVQGRVGIALWYAASHIDKDTTAAVANPDCNYGSPVLMSPLPNTDVQKCWEFEGNAYVLKVGYLKCYLSEFVVPGDWYIVHNGLPCPLQIADSGASLAKAKELAEQRFLKHYQVQAQFIQQSLALLKKALVK